MNLRQVSRLHIPDLLNLVFWHPVNKCRPVTWLQNRSHYYDFCYRQYCQSHSPPVQKVNDNFEKPVVSTKQSCNSESAVVPDHVVGTVENHFDFNSALVSKQDLQSQLVQTMLVYPNFVSCDEESDLVKEIEPYLTRLHYETSHWDDAIHGYRETERSKWSRKNEKIINRIRQLAFPPTTSPLKLVHLLDLAKDGVIKPHVDSIRFCGNTIAGLSLLSDSVMTLRHHVQKEYAVDIYLPRFSLYIMKDFARYEWTHEILKEEASMFKTEVIPRSRRISVICRNEPDQTEDSLISGPTFKPL